MSESTDFESELSENLAGVMRECGKTIIAHIQETLKVQGSVKPWNVAPPGSPPVNFNNKLVDSFLAPEVTVDGTTITLTIASDAWSESFEQDGARPISQEEEFGGMAIGHEWGASDGKAFAVNWDDPPHMVYVGSPHYMAPRPFMAPALPFAAECVRKAIEGE